MHKNVYFTYLRLRNPSQDVLFSGPEDYRATIDVLADLSLNHTPIGAFCLLEQEVHLIAIADETQSLALSRALMTALTGNAEHPLGRHWKCNAINAKQLPNLVASIHRLPCQKGLCSKADIHPWSSHQAFAQPGQTPHWLATEAIWRTLTPRYSNRVRAYLHKLEQPSLDHSAPFTPKPKQAASPQHGEGLTERRVAEFVLNDHQTQWVHLTHHRSNRRKLYLAGLSCALCQYLNIYDEKNTRLNALFNCPKDELEGLARLASREASHYIVTSASKLSTPTTTDTLINDKDTERSEPKVRYSAALSCTEVQADEHDLLAAAFEDDQSELDASAKDVDLALDFSAESDVDLPSIRLVAGR